MISIRCEWQRCVQTNDQDINKLMYVNTQPKGVNAFVQVNELFLTFRFVHLLCTLYLHLFILFHYFLVIHKSLKLLNNKLLFVGIKLVNSYYFSKMISIILAKINCYNKTTAPQCPTNFQFELQKSCLCRLLETATKYKCFKQAKNLNKLAIHFLS